MTIQQLKLTALSAVMFGALALPVAASAENYGSGTSSGAAAQGQAEQMKPLSFAEADTNNSGSVSQEEFTAYLAQWNKSADEAKADFDAKDKNGDDQLSQDELQGQS